MQLRIVCLEEHISNAELVKATASAAAEIAPYYGLGDRLPGPTRLV